MEIVKAPVNIVELLELTVSSFVPACRKKGLELHMFIDKGVPPVFESDASRIRQIVSNLIGNGIKFTERGSIRIDMSFCKRRRIIDFSVKDTGIGIPEDKFEKLFTPFFQVESHNSRRFGGTGLGLSISRKIAHLLGGDIDFQSVLGEGSTFAFHLRVENPGEESAFRTFQDASIALASNRVQTKAVMADQLENWGCKVRHIELSREAIQKAFSSRSCELLIIDEEEDNKAVSSLMLEPGSRSVRYLRLSCQAGKSASKWIGEGLTIAQPWKPSELNACFSKILKNLEPLKVQEGSVQPRQGGLETSFAEEYPHDILVVEDNAINAKVLETILKKLGYKPGLAVNGEECLKALQEKPYDIVFMDLQMPVMDGYQATVRILKSDTITHDVFITSFTANARQDDRDACEAVGMHDFVAKPARPHKIVEVLRRAHEWLEEKARIQK
ncbi:MAG: response regulator, partial [Verrucomicrobiae bacterium]|nr:response regulator [Verrucomicrobiae bacterium]